MSGNLKRAIVALVVVTVVIGLAVATTIFGKGRPILVDAPQVGVIV